MTDFTRYFSLLLFCVYLPVWAQAAYGGAPAAGPTAAQVIDWQAPVVIETGPAYAGAWRMNDSEFHYVDDPAVSLRDDGIAAVVWVDNERQDVFFQRYDENNAPQLDAPVNVSRSPEVFSWLPQVLLTKEDQAYAVWQEIVFSGGSHGGEIFFARSDDGGRHFAQPLNLSNTIAGAGKGRLTKERWDNGSLDVAIGDKGEIFVAWTEYEGALRFRRSLDGGRSFGEIIHISGSEEEPARAPVLATGPNGSLYLAWTVGEDAAADIHMARSADNGASFGAERRVHISSDRSDTPGLAVDNEQNVHLVYAEVPSVPSKEPRTHYLRLNAAGEPQIQPRVLSRNGKVSAGATAPSVGVDRYGRVYVIWEHHPVAGQRARGLGFVVSSDAGRAFTPPEIIPGSKGSAGVFNGNLQGQLGRKLSVSDDGKLAVTHSQFHYGVMSRVVLIRGQYGR